MATVPIFSQYVRPAPEVPTVHGVTDKDLDNIVSNVSAKYHRVLIHLGLSSNTIETLEIKYHKDPARVLFEGLVQWRNEKTKSSHCLWEELLKAIEEGAENGMYADEWRTELRERGIRTCEHRPEMEDCRDVKGSHLGSTASASAAELKTRSATSLRRRHLLPQQQQQQQQQQRPVQKRSDKPCSSPDASSQTSANKTKTSHLNGRSSSNRLSSSTSRSSAECHSPQITTVPIGLPEKAPSPAIALDDLKELHQCLIQYMQVPCRIVRHRETGMGHLDTAPDDLVSAFKMSSTTEIIGRGLTFVGTFIMIAGYVPYHAFSPIDLHTFIVSMILETAGLVCMLFGLLVTIFGSICIGGCGKRYKVLKGSTNWFTSFRILYLQFRMARKALFMKLNATQQEYRIDSNYNVLRLTFKSLKKPNDTQFTLERLLFAEWQMKNKAEMSSIASLAAVTSVKAAPVPSYLVPVLGFVVPLLVILFGAAIKSLIVTSLAALLFNLIGIMTTISIRKQGLSYGIALKKVHEFVSCETDRLQPLAQIFDSIIPGRLAWLRTTKHQQLFV